MKRTIIISNQIYLGCLTDVGRCIEEKGDRFMTKNGWFWKICHKNIMYTTKEGIILSADFDEEDPIDYDVIDYFGTKIAVNKESFKIFNQMYKALSHESRTII